MVATFIGWTIFNIFSLLLIDGLFFELLSQIPLIKNAMENGLYFFGNRVLFSFRRIDICNTTNAFCFLLQIQPIIIALVPGNLDIDFIYCLFQFHDFSSICLSDDSKDFESFRQLLSSDGWDYHLFRELFPNGGFSVDLWEHSRSGVWGDPWLYAINFYRKLTKCQKMDGCNHHFVSFM